MVSENQTNGSRDEFIIWELSPGFVKFILSINKNLYIKRINSYFGVFETRTMRQNTFVAQNGRKPFGYTGSFFEKYSKKADQNWFDGKDVSAAISLSITGYGFWVASLDVSWGAFLFQALIKVRTEGGVSSLYRSINVASVINI